MSILGKKSQALVSVNTVRDNGKFSHISIFRKAFANTLYKVRYLCVVDMKVDHEELALIHL